MTRLPRFDPSNASSRISADFRIKQSSRQSILLYTNDMVEPVQPLDINTLHNVQVVEELIQLVAITNAKIIANLH